MDTTTESAIESTKNPTALAHKVRFSAAAPDSEPFVDTKSLFPNTIDRGVYNHELASIHADFPYSLIRGRINPYISRPIDTQADYDLYCHCLALRRMCDRQLLVASTAVRTAQKNEAAAKREAAQYKQGLSACERNLSECKRALALSWKKAASVQCDYDALLAHIERRKKNLRRCFLIFLAALYVFFAVRNLLPSGTEPSDRRSGSGKASYSEPVSDTASKPVSEAVSKPVSEGSERPDGYVSDYYIGNKSSHKFHRTTCSYLPDEDNQRKFKTRDAAISAGYDPCGHCNP